MKFTEYLTKQNSVFNETLLPITIPNPPDIKQVCFFQVVHEMNAASVRMQKHYQKMHIDQLKNKLSQPLRALTETMPAQHHLVLYDGQRFCVVVEFEELDLRLLHEVKLQFLVFIQILAKEAYRAYGLRPNHLDVVLKLGWVHQDLLYTYLQDFKVEDRANRVEMMSNAWKIQAPLLNIPALEAKASLSALLASTDHRKESLWAFLPAAMQNYLASAPTTVVRVLKEGREPADLPKDLNFSTGFVVAYFPTHSEWQRGNGDKQLKNYVRVLQTAQACENFLKLPAYQEWTYSYLLRAAAGTEDPAPKLSAIVLKGPLQQWLLLRDYLLRVAIHRDDLACKKEWLGMSAAFFNMARTVIRMGLLNVSLFHVSLRNSFFVLLAVLPLYFFERAFAKINTPVYAGVCSLGRRSDSVERVLLQYRALLFKLCVMIQPPIASFATLNMIELVDLSKLGASGVFNIILAVQLLRSAAVWMRFAETVGLPVITKNGFFEQVLWFLQNMGAVRLAYALWPLAEAWIYSSALDIVVTTHLGLSKVLGKVAFGLGLLGQSAFTRAYDVNYFLRPLWRAVIDQLHVDNYFSRFTNRLVENAFENPLLEPFFSLRIVPELFANFGFSSDIYLMLMPLFKISAGMARGYLIDLALAKRLEHFGYTVPMLYGMTVVSLLSQCTQVYSKFREVRYEMLDPTAHAKKEAITFTQRFKLPEERPYLKTGFLCLSAALSVVFDIFLKDRCLTDDMVGMIEHSVLTRASFVYMLFIFLYTAFEGALLCECRKPAAKEKESRVQPAPGSDCDDYGFDNVMNAGKDSNLTSPKKLPASPRRRTPARPALAW